MRDQPLINELFYGRTGMEERRVQGLVGEALRGMDDGELFLEYRASESFVFDDGQLRQANHTVDQGFGLRSVLGEATGYAHASELSEAAIRRAMPTVQAVNYGQNPVHAEAPVFGSNKPLYGSVNPLDEIPFAAKLTVLTEIDAYLRGRDPRVRQVSASLLGSWQAVQIIRADGRSAHDIRPLVRINVQVMVEENGQMETGSSGAGARVGYGEYLESGRWQGLAEQALAQALVNLEAAPAPAGEMPVVIGGGWCGVLLHEAVGHGLEGDFNRKKTSAFAGLMGSRVAAPGVTIVDDGGLADRRGSVTIDDEGTPGRETMLIEDGILKGYMQDRLNARLMGMAPTGNGRRESYAHQPMPRMTNTYMLGGGHTRDEIIASVKRGLYATHFGGGQVDITSGKFVFSATEAYLIEDGKVTRPVKGATLIGNGPESLKHVSMIGDDMALDPGIGTCGKAGQGVPVGVGQPTLKLDRMTVGGTEV